MISIRLTTSLMNSRLLNNLPNKQSLKGWLKQKIILKAQKNRRKMRIFLRKFWKSKGIL